MREGIGRGRTHVCHPRLSDQLYAGYSKSVSLRVLVAVVGEESLGERDRRYLWFGERFEQEFLNQGYYEDRSIIQTLDLGWDLLADLPERELNRIPPKYICFHPAHRTKALEIDDPEPD